MQYHSYGSEWLYQSHLQSQSWKYSYGLCQFPCSNARSVSLLSLPLSKRRYNNTPMEQRNYAQKEWVLYVLGLLSNNLISKSVFKGNLVCTTSSLECLRKSSWISMFIQNSILLMVFSVHVPAWLIRIIHVSSWMTSTSITWSKRSWTACRILNYLSKLPLPLLLKSIFLLMLAKRYFSIPRFHPLADSSSHPAHSQDLHRHHAQAWCPGGYRYLGWDCR